jgi:hypothetical protein
MASLLNTTFTSGTIGSVPDNWNHGDTTAVLCVRTRPGSEESSVSGAYLNITSNAKLVQEFIVTEQQTAQYGFSIDVMIGYNVEPLTTDTIEVKSRIYTAI